MIMLKKLFILIVCLSMILFAQNIIAQSIDTSNLKINLDKMGYKLLFNDNFDSSGSLNSVNWFLRKNQKMGGVSYPGNVEQGFLFPDINSKGLNIRFTYDSLQMDALKFKGGGIVSTHNFGYGYYEAKVKLYGGSNDLAGLHQSFWSMGLTGTNEAEGASVRDEMVHKDLIPAENRVLEIDAFEMDSKGNHLGQNYHIYTPLHINKAPKPNHFERQAGKWFKMGYEWLPGQINYYVDDALVTSLKLDSQWLVFAPQNVWFTALPVDVKSWGGLKVPPVGASMQVDYFNFYAKRLPNVNRIGNSGFEYSVLNGNPKYPVSWIVSKYNGEDTTSIEVVTDSINANTGNRFLSIKSNKIYHASLKQLIEYIPDGVYSLSAFIKSSGTQKIAELSIQTGGKSTVLKLRKTKKWKKIELSNVIIKNQQALIEIKVVGDEKDWLLIDDIILAEKNN